MSVRIMDDGHSRRAVLYDSVTDWAFGPVATECEGCGADAVQVLEGFIAWTTGDPREYSDDHLQALWTAYCRVHHDHEEEQT